MRYVVVVLAGCGFARTNGTGGAADVDAAVEATPVCTMRPAETPQAQPSVGGDGGGGRPDLACPVGELPIGAEFETSMTELGNGFNHEQVVVTTHVRCGRLDGTTANTVLTTATGSLTREGTGCTTPVVLSGEQRCPPGAVMVGLRANASGGQFSSYNSVQIVCAALASDGAVTAATTTLDFRPITGNFSNDVEASTCPAGTAIVAVGGKAGCTQDQMWAECARLVCN